MTPIDYAAESLQGNLGFMNNTLADFSEADFFVRPCPGANHSAWQVGQLIRAETMMVNGVQPGAAPALPEGFGEKFTKETSKIDDPAFFGSKKELMDQFAKTRGATIAWVKTLKLADLERPSPERIRGMAPNVGHLLFLLTNHVSMHVGQMQVIRRKLGKPILF